jgi:hypothetical protein
MDHGMLRKPYFYRNKIDLMILVVGNTAINSTSRSTRRSSS